MAVTPIKSDSERKLSIGEVILKIEGGNKFYTESEMRRFLTDAGLNDYSFFLSNMIVARKT